MANEFVQRIVDKNIVISTMLQYLPSSKMSNTGFRVFDCPICARNGKPDTKQRGGVKINGNDVGISCFKCGFSSGYEVGNLLSRSMKEFLSAINVPQHEIDQLNFRASELHYILGRTDAKPTDYTFIPKFSETPLPNRCKLITEWLEEGCEDRDFIRVAEYALTRGDDIFTQVMWTPDSKWRGRMIIPFMFKGKSVGWTGRLVGNGNASIPRYLNELQTDYLLNCDLMSERDRAFIILVEGALDAKAIDGISPLGAKLSKRQANWINGMGKKVILVADRDDAGSRLIDVALENGWAVSFPRLAVGGQQWWQNDCKDSAEAVKRYGRLYTLRSILETSTNRRLKIEINRKIMTTR